MGEVGRRVYVLETTPPGGKAELTLPDGGALFDDGTPSIVLEHGAPFSLRGVTVGSGTLVVRAGNQEETLEIAVLEARKPLDPHEPNPMLRPGCPIGVLQFRLPELGMQADTVEVSAALRGIELFRCAHVPVDPLPQAAGGPRVVVDFGDMRIGEHDVTGDLVVTCALGDAIVGRHEVPISNIVHDEGVVPEVPAGGGTPIPSSGIGTPVPSLIYGPTDLSIPTTVPVPEVSEPQPDDSVPEIFGEELGGPAAIPPFFGSCPAPAVVEEGESATTERSFVAGDPVYVHSGELVHGEQDYLLSGRGPALRLVRTYRSRVRGQSIVGWGWSLNWEKSLVDLAPLGGAGHVYKNGFGRSDRYASGGEAETPGLYSRVERGAGSTYVIAHANGSATRFGAQGQLARIEDRNGDGTSFAYDGCGRLVGARDALGRTVTLSYGAHGLLETVADSAGREIRYRYYERGEAGGSQHDLKSTTATARSLAGYSAGETTVYTYQYDAADPSRIHTLVSVTQPAAVADLGIDPAQPFDAGIVGRLRDRASLLNEYDPVGRVVEQRHHTGTFGFKYHPSGKETTVIDRAIETGSAARQTTVFRYDGNIPLQIEQRSVLGHAVFTLEHGDAPYLESTTHVLPSGRRLVFTYDRSNPDPRRRGDVVAMEWVGGKPGERVKTTQTLNRFGQPVQIVEPRGHVPGASPTRYATDLEYDARGNLTRASFPAVSRYDAAGRVVGRSPRATRTIEYSARGQVARVVDSSGALREYEYFPPGTAAMGLLRKVRHVAADGSSALETEFELDELGRPTHVTQPNGSVISAEYDAFNRIVETRDPIGARRLYRYDAGGRLQLIALENLQPDDQGGYQPGAPAWFTETRVHDDFGRIVAVTRGSTDPAGATFGVRFRYDEADRLVERVSNGGTVTRYEFGPRSLATATVIAAGTADESRHRIEYGLEGEVLRVTDAGGFTVRHEYDWLGRLVALYDPPPPAGGASASMRMEYDVSGHLVRSLRLDAGGTVVKDIRREYDERGRVAYEEDVLAGTRAVRSYDNGGRPVDISLYDVAGLTLLRRTRHGFAVGRFGEPTWVEDGEGNRVEYVYDASLRLSEVRRVGTHGWIALRTCYEYDAKNRVSRIMRSSDDRGVLQASEVAFDSRNLPVRTVDPNGGQVRNGYNDLGQLVSVDRVFDATTMHRDRYEHDAEGRLSRTVDAMGNPTHFEYNGRGDRVRSTAWDGAVAHVIHETVYDVRGLPIRVTDARGSVVTNRFDELGRLVRRDVSRAAGVAGTTFETFRYDAMSRLVEARNDFSVFTCLYNSQGLVEREVQDHLIAPGTAGILSRRFDAAGNLTRLTYPQGRVVDFERDLLGRPTRALEASRVLAEWSYIAPQFPSRRAHDNGTESMYTYDALARLGGVEHRGPAGVVHRAFEYAYDAFGNVLAEAENVTGLQERFTYDPLHNLRSAELGRTVATGAAGRSIEYEYDAVGNRLRVQEASRATLYSTNGLNQYTAIGPAGAQQPVRWDADLNLAENAGRRLSHDYSGCLVHAEVGQVVYELTYDAIRRLIRKRVTRPGEPSRETHYYYDDHHVIETQGAESATYVYGPAYDELVSYRRSGADYYVHQKRLWTVSHVTDASGAVVESYRYEPYGARHVFDGDGRQIVESAVGNVAGFAGRWLEAELGLYYFRARWYDPELGRFITPDPYGWLDGLNVYRYAKNNPATFFDPFGTTTEDFLAGMRDGFLERFLGGWWDAITTIADIVLNAGEYVDTLTTMLSALTDPEARADTWNAVRDAVEEELSDAWNVVEGAINALSGEMSRAAGAALGAALGYLAARLMRGGGSIAAFFASIGRKVKKLLRGARRAPRTAGSPPRCPGNGTGCFLAGTLVLTRDGARHIEDVRVNDEVLARDEDTGEIGYHRVVKTFPGYTHEVCRLTVVADGSAACHLLCTPDHEFYRLDDGRWTRASALQAGDRLLAPKQAGIRVVTTEVRAEHAPTWNFEVEGCHTYFVTAHPDVPGVWVHNACGVNGAIPIPWGERIPVQPLGPGMVPRPGVGIGYDRRPYRHLGQVTVSTATQSTTSGGVRRALQREAHHAGLPRMTGTERHETPLFGNTTQTDVQRLAPDEHRGAGRYAAHHRAVEGGYVGGTAEVLERNLGNAPRPPRCPP